MKLLVRSKTERFTDLLKREASKMKVAVNGPMYGLTLAGKFAAGFGGLKAPLPPSDTVTEGEAMHAGKIVAGRPAPKMFYFAKLPLPSSKQPFSRYVAGSGDPPSYSSDAIGGVGPLIIGQLPYGAGNHYKKGVSGPSIGDLGLALRPQLLQRSNATITDADAPPHTSTTGKVILASCTQRRKILVGIQPNGWLPAKRMRLWFPD